MVEILVLEVNFLRNSTKLKMKLLNVSRIDYLRGKYGKLTSEELNNFINLKQEIKKYIEANSKKLGKSDTNMVSKVWDTSKQKVI